MQLEELHLARTRNFQARFSLCLCDSVVKGIPKTERPAPFQHGPPGGLFGIDQEVVTLRGLYGNSGFCNRTTGATYAGIQS